MHQQYHVTGLRHQKRIHYHLTDRVPSSVSCSTSKMSSNTVSPYITLVSGSIAAIGSTFSKQPLDRLKWLRQVSEGKSTFTQSSYFHVFRSILSTEGITGLFRGVNAAIFRNVPHAAMIYTAFPIVRKQVILWSESTDYRIPQSPAFINTVSGAMASIVVTCITHPGDTLRVRYTVQFETLRYRTYSDLFHSMRSEGITVLDIWYLRLF